MSEVEVETADVQGEVTRRGNGRRVGVRIVPVALVVVVVIAVGLTAFLRGSSSPISAHLARAATPSTIALSELPESIAGIYTYAADHAGHFAELPCYCGCDQSLGHGNLADCFVNADGDWDAHAFGCGICTAEAITARQQLDAGIPIGDVRQSIIDSFGPPLQPEPEVN